MNEYTTEQVDKMRQNLAEAEHEILDLDDLINILIDGCEGYDNWTDHDVTEQHESHFGEEETKEMMDGIV